RYVRDAKRWYRWNGRRWVPDAEAHLHRAAKAMVRNMYEEAAKIDNDTDRRELADWALQCESMTRRKAMIGLAQFEQGIIASTQDFDQHPYLLNLLNGTYDLRAGRFREHRQTDMLTRICPVSYDPAATCPRWLQFLDETFPDHEEIIGF